MDETFNEAEAAAIKEAFKTRNRATIPARSLPATPAAAWVEKPQHAGYYFYATRDIDWDLARPVAVHRIEYGDGRVVFEALIGTWLDVQDVPGVWFGPFRVERPPWA